MSRVLLLNADYTPISTISMERSMILLCGEKVELVEASKSRKIKTIRNAFPYPEIVKLKRYHYIKKKRMMPTKHNIMQRDKHECQYCGSTDRTKLTIDHIVPVSKGGQNTWDNLTTACFRCNNRKGDKSLEESGLKLRKKPAKITHLNAIQYHGAFYEMDSWDQYLFLNS